MKAIVSKISLTEDQLFDSIRDALMNKKSLLTHYPFQALDLRIENYRCQKVTAVKSVRNLKASEKCYLSDCELEKFLVDFKRKLRHISKFDQGTIRVYYYAHNGTYTYTSFTFAKELHLPMQLFSKPSNRTMEADLPLFKSDIIKTLIRALKVDFREEIAKRKCSTLILHTRNCLPQRVLWSISLSDTDPDLSANASIKAILDEKQVETICDLIRIRLEQVKIQHIGTVMIRFAWQDEMTCRFMLEIYDNRHLYGVIDLFPLESAILV